MVPQIYSARPLVVEWFATDEALYDKVGSGKERVAETSTERVTTMFRRDRL